MEAKVEPKIRHTSLTWSRARWRLAHFLDLLEANFDLNDASMLTEAVPQAGDDLENEGDELIPALIDAMEYGQTRGQLFAAACLGRIDARYPEKIKDREVLKRAASRLVQGVKSHAFEERLWACSLLTTIAPPRAAVPTLRELAADPDPHTATLAAAALAWGGGSTQHSLATLTRALRSNEPALAAVGASGVARMGIKAPEAMRALTAALRATTQPCKYHILGVLAGLGTGAHPTLDEIVAVAGDERNAPVVRGKALSALAAISPTHPVGVELVRRALVSGVPELMRGATDSLKVWNTIPSGAAVALAELVGDDDVDVRVAAALALAAMGAQAKPALPALLARVGVDGDRNVWVATAEALKAIGQPAVDGLVEIVRAGGAHTLAHAAGVLSVIGIDAVLSLIEAAERETSDDVKMVLLVVLRDIGPMATPILPTLRSFLATTNNEAVAQCIVMCLFVLGRAAAPAAPEVARWMLIGERETAAWCERVLWNMGPAAAEAMSDVLPQLPAEARRRIERNLERQLPPDAEDYSMLEDIDEPLLRAFVLIGDHLLDGNKCSYRELATRVAFDGKRLSANSIGSRVASLQRVLGIPLTTHTKKRAGTLTPTGRETHAKVKRFLRVKALRRKSVTTAR
ncbi:MAG: HEAT repeat domain-containing protein [Planctomycetes bacterium]|nr:HEAT repeat domain-containing protein [Planctomycetota bacterium]